MRESGEALLNKNGKALLNNNGKALLNKALHQRESVIFIILIFIVIAMTIAKPTTFATQENIFNILKQISIVAIVAIGQTFVITTGGIDLSVGYSLGLGGIVMAQLMELGIDDWLSIACSVLVCVLVGFFNGLIITTLNLPPFIATLGTANICRGLGYIITKGFPIAFKNSFIMALGNGYFGPVPIMTIIMAILVLIAHYLLTKHRFGNRVLSLGGNETAALLSGINVKNYKIMVYTLTGFLCGIAGLITAGRLLAGNPNAGNSFDMDTIAAAIVGGTAMSGGEGSIIGTILGALLLGVIKNSLVLLNTNMYWQTVVIGIIIIVVCGMDHVAHRTRKKS